MLAHLLLEELQEPLGGLTFFNPILGRVRLEGRELTYNPERFAGGDPPRTTGQPHVVTNNGGGQAAVVLQAADHRLHICPGLIKNTLYTYIHNLHYITMV